MRSRLGLMALCAGWLLSLWPAAPVVAGGARSHTILWATLRSTDATHGGLAAIDPRTGGQKPLLSGLSGTIDSLVVDRMTITTTFVYLTAAQAVNGCHNCGGLYYADVTHHRATLLAWGLAWYGAEDLAWTPDHQSLLVSCSGLGIIYRYNPATHLATVLMSGFDLQHGLAVLPDGTLWTDEEAGHTLDQLDLGSGQLIQRLVLPTVPDGMAYDTATAALYVSGNRPGSIMRYLPATNHINVIVTIGTGNDGIAADGLGNLYVVNFTTRGLVRVPLANPKDYQIIAPNPPGYYWDDVVIFAPAT